MAIEISSILDFHAKMPILVIGQLLKYNRPTVIKVVVARNVAKLVVDCQSNLLDPLHLNVKVKLQNAK